MNLASLQSQLHEMREQVAHLQEALERSHRENKILRQKLDALARRFFGKKSEQLNAAQLELLLSGLGEESVDPNEEEEPPPSRERQRSCTNPRRIRTPENLEVVRELIEPELVQAEPDQWKCIGREVSRQLDYQPGKFFWQETVRPKYVRRSQRALPPVIAPAPERVADRILAAPGLLAQLLVGKYCDHLPFYRQEQIFWRRYGVFIARQQMVQWTAQSVRLLSGISDCLKREVQGSSYLQVDETPVRYQDPSLHGRCGQGYLWTALAPGRCVVYEWYASRAARCLETLLGDFAGRLQCDGYSAYPAFAKTKHNLVLLGCWAHARRKMFEAQEQAPRVAGWILNQIGLLYRWERKLRRNRAGPVLRQVYRSSHHRMVIARLHRALIRLQPRYLPQSPMGKAISYALNQWPYLERFLDHGEAEADNNQVENAVRPTAVGKKNWLFFGSEEAGQRSAVIYTLIENCRLHGVEPYAYLKDVLERLPTCTNQQVDQLTPLKWKQTRQAAEKLAA